MFVFTLLNDEGINKKLCICSKTDIRYYANLKKTDYIIFKYLKP